MAAVEAKYIAASRNQCTGAQKLKSCPSCMLPFVLPFVLPFMLPFTLPFTAVTAMCICNKFLSQKLCP